MSEIQSRETRSLERDELVRSALEGKKAAIQGYDAILWKIRAGYITVLYSGLALVVDEKTSIAFSAIAKDSVRSVVIFFLILGFSASAFLLDLTYKRKKVRVIVVHDHLMDLALNKDTTDDAIEGLLHISGETFAEKLPGEIEKQYKTKLVWNLWRVLVPLYCATPVLAILVLAWIVAR